MSEQTTPKRNSDIAKVIAQFADALNGYDHLPAFDNVMWQADGSIYPSFTSHSDVAAQLKDMHAWAHAFGADITVVRNDNISAYLSFEFEMSGVRMFVHESVYRDKADTLLSELPGGKEKVTMSPDQFGAIADRLAETAAQRAWRAAYKRHYDASRSFNAPDENAAEYAEKKTVEELGANPDVTALLQEA